MDNFVQVFSPLLRSGIPSDELHVYLILCDFAGKKGYCWPSDRTIGGFIGKSQDTVQRILGRLQKRGLISRDRVEVTNENPTGRVITTHGRVTPLPQKCDTTPARRTRTPAAPLRHEPHTNGKQYRPDEPDEGARAEENDLKQRWEQLPETERATTMARIAAENPGLARWPKMLEPLCLAALRETLSCFR